MLDLLISGGTIIDGTRKPRFTADLAIRGDRIEAIGNLAAASTRTTIDARGKIVAPGFIDVHNHSDGWLLKETNFWPKTSQGFTTEILMADGISYAPVDELTWKHWHYYLRALDGLLLSDYGNWRTLDAYLARLDGTTAQNTAVHVPYANVRSLYAGWGRHAPDDYQRRSIAAELRRGMEAGAVGLSTGLDYVSQIFATTDELVDACRAIAPYGGLYVTHIRYKLGLMAALNEAVEIGRRSGAKVHISHLKGFSKELVHEVLNWIDTHARKEVDFSFEVYPYQRGSTMLNYLLPYEVWQEGPLNALSRLHLPEVKARFRQGLACLGEDLDRMYIAWLGSRDNQRHIGQLLVDYAAQVQRPIEEALINLLTEENLAVLLVIHGQDDHLVRPILQHDLMMVGSDGIYFPPPSRVHPRVYGSAGRILGPCVRDWKLFSLEDAVYKLAYWPARRFGLAGRGEIRAGAFADLVVFDAATVSDKATYENPHQTCVGIEHVLVNGRLVVEGGAPVTDFGERAPGRALRMQR
jgi:N-acyl-D-amino-acid deacylase